MLAQSIGLPYINGLATVYARRPVNVTVEHRAREHGRSGYGPTQIIPLICAFSSATRRSRCAWSAASACSRSIAGFALGTYFLWRALQPSTQVPQVAWSS